MKWINKTLNSHWWKLLNSALVVLLLTFLLTLFTKTKNLESTVKNYVRQTSHVSVENENRIEIINENVVRVEKQIANLEDTIRQIYESIKAEAYMKNDINSRVKIFPKENGSNIFFELSHIPVTNSVEVTSNKGTSSPATYNLLRNIVMLRTKAKADNILNNEGDFYFIKYHQNNFAKEDILTIRAMDSKEAIEAILIAEHAEWISLLKNLNKE